MRLGQGQTFAQLRCMKYESDIGVTFRVIANSLEENTVEIACLDVILRDILDIIVLTMECSQRHSPKDHFAKRDENESELHFNIPLSPSLQFHINNLCS